MLSPIRLAFMSSSIEVYMPSLYHPPNLPLPCLFLLFLSPPFFIF